MIWARDGALLVACVFDCRFGFGTAKKYDYKAFVWLCVCVCVLIVVCVRFGFRFMTKSLYLSC